MIKPRNHLQLSARRLFCLWLLCLWSVAFCRDAPGPAAQTATFTNPVVPAGADPWVIQWEGDYYLSQSRRGASIWINRFENLSDIGQDNWVEVWRPPPGTPYSRNVWAPELMRLRGKWYIYFAADDGDNANHRMYVLKGTSQNPQDPFVFAGKISDPSDRWAIDGTVIEMPGDELYFVWSGWEGTTDVRQDLYIAPMSDPLTISGPRVLISQPEHPWETHGRPHVNEGPTPLWNGSRLFLIYSASGSWTDHYCLGQLTWTGGDPLDPASWLKHPIPVFAPTENVFGPGHASFVKSRDGTEDWIVYHSARHSGAGWRRHINMQPFTWNDDGTPHFGDPVPPGQPLPLPSGDRLPPQPQTFSHSAPRPIELFNGATLDGFYTWLVDSGRDDPRNVFTVTNRQVRISGEGLGYLATSNTYSNYHLRLEYRWGSLNWPYADRIGKARDSGLFLHAFGPDGNSHDGAGAFMAAIECNIFEGATGDFLLIRGTDAEGQLLAPRLTATISSQRDSDGWFTYHPDGPPQTVERWGRVNWRHKSPEWRDLTGFRGPRDLENPPGEWNTLEAICRGNSIQILLNGTLVNEAAAVWPAAGKILLQCEGSEIFFRSITLRALPKNPPPASASAGND